MVSQPLGVVFAVCSSKHLEEIRQSEAAFSLSPNVPLNLVPKKIKKIPVNVFPFTTVI